MPIASAPTTSQRLLALLSLLQARRDWPAHVLAERLDVSERTVRRDIDRLRELDYAIAATRGPDGGYRLEAGTRMPPLMLDDGQVLAITLALRTAGSLAAGLADDAERALATLQQLLPAHLSRHIDDLAVAGSEPAGGDGESDPAVLRQIADAIRTTSELRFDYAVPGDDTPADERSVRRTEPHHLLLHGGHWYLLGYSSERGDWRTYRVDRISPRSHTGRPFSPRPIPGGSPARFLAARFKGAAGRDDAWPCWGTATLNAPLRAIAPYVGDGTAHEVAPNRSRVTLGSWSWGSLAAAFARYEADLADVEPAELRAAFAELGARLGRMR